MGSVPRCGSPRSRLQPSRRRNTFFFHQPSRRCGATRCIVARFTSDASKDIWTSFDLSVNACLSSFDYDSISERQRTWKSASTFLFSRWCTRVVVIHNAASSYQSSKAPKPAVLWFLSRCSKFILQLFTRGPCLAKRAVSRYWIQQSSGGNERRSRWQVEKEEIGTKRKKENGKGESSPFLPWQPVYISGYLEFVYAWARNVAAGWLTLQTGKPHNAT